MATAKKPRRPSAGNYSRALSERICQLLMQGISLRSICERDDMPRRASVMRWLAKHDEFAARYAAAREVGMDMLADEILQIADTPRMGTKKVTKPDGIEITEGDMIDHRKLQVDARKWYLSKLAPKKYGEKIQQEITGRDGGPVVIAGAPTDADL